MKKRLLAAAGAVTAAAAISTTAFAFSAPTSNQAICAGLFRQADAIHVRLESGHVTPAQAAVLEARLEQIVAQENAHNCD